MTIPESYGEAFSKSFADNFSKLASNPTNPLLHLQEVLAFLQRKGIAPGHAGKIVAQAVMAVSDMAKDAQERRKLPRGTP